MLTDVYITLFLVLLGITPRHILVIQRFKMKENSKAFSGHFLYTPFGNIQAKVRTTMQRADVINILICTMAPVSATNEEFNTYKPVRMRIRNPGQKR